MERRFGLFFWGVVAFAILMAMAIKVISGGLINYFQAALLLSPFIFILFLRYRALWHVWIPIALVAVRLKIPIRGFDKLTLIILLILLLLITSILDAAMRRGRLTKEKKWEDKAAFLLASLLTLRFLYDRPGFVAFGAEQGGLLNSLEYVIAAWGYFVVQRVASLGHFTRKQLRVSAGVVAALFANALIRTHLFGEHLFVRALGEQETWMLTAMLLSLIITSPSFRAKMFLYSATAFVFLGMGAISTYRARVLYILSNVLAITSFTQYTKRFLMILAVGGVVGLAGAITFQEHMPVGMARFLSLFTRVEKTEGVGGQYGAEDSFRGTLYQLAWEQICRHPVAGRGFGISVEEALTVLAVSGQTTLLEMMAMGGAYHNSIVALAVTAGLPAAVLFTVILISIPRKFSRMLKTRTDGDFRTWGFVIIGFFFAVLCMALLNGGPREFMSMMILTGYMRGMMQNPAAVIENREDMIGLVTGTKEDALSLRKQPNRREDLPFSARSHPQPFRTR